jgi:hypothetical protein
MFSFFQLRTFPESLPPRLIHLSAAFSEKNFMDGLHSAINETTMRHGQPSCLHDAADLADGIQDDEPLASDQPRPPGYVISACVWLIGSIIRWRIARNNRRDPSDLLFITLRPYLSQLCLPVLFCTATLRWRGWQSQLPSPLAKVRTGHAAFGLRWSSLSSEPFSPAPFPLTIVFQLRETNH